MKFYDFATAVKWWNPFLYLWVALMFLIFLIAGIGAGIWLWIELIAEVLKTKPNELFTPSEKLLINEGMEAINEYIPEEEKHKPMKKLPFDAEKARQGHPVCTRDGRMANYCATVPFPNHGYPLLFEIDEKKHIFTEKGEYLIGEASVLDLFLVDTGEVFTREYGGEIDKILAENLKADLKRDKLPNRYPTTIKAIEVESGDLVTFQGPYMLGETLESAQKWANENGFGYCKVVSHIEFERD